MSEQTDESKNLAGTKTNIRFFDQGRVLGEVEAAKQVAVLEQWQAWENKNPQRKPTTTHRVWFLSMLYINKLQCFIKKNSCRHEKPMQ